jgi:F1F0 ATPase subunit 2
MTMNESPALVLSWVAGGVLGVIFFGGLWWTVERLASSPRPGLWMLGSLLLRMSVTLAGFYLASGGRWGRMLACLAGFIMARLVVMRLCRPRGDVQTLRSREAGNAP